MVENIYPDNSRKARDESNSPPAEKKIEKVISGSAVRRKKPLSQRFMQTFFGGSDAGTIWEYLLKDVVVPATKDTITDVVQQGVERALFGEARSRTVGSRTALRHNAQTQYNRISNGIGAGSQLIRPEPRREMSHRARATHDFGEIVLDTRVDAQDVLDSMYTLLSQYNRVTVAQLYDMVGITPAFTDHKYGWVNLQGSDAHRVKDGYLLDLPNPEELD